MIEPQYRLLIIPSINYSARDVLNVNGTNISVSLLRGEVGYYLKDIFDPARIDTLIQLNFPLR